MKKAAIHKILKTINLILFEPIINLFLNKNVVIILTPIKTGSTSVYTSLMKNKYNTVIKSHFISQIGIEDYSKKIRRKEDKKFYRLKKSILTYERTLLIRKIKNYKNKIYIIVTIRNPIDQYISGIFHLWEHHKLTLFNTKEDYSYHKTINYITDSIGNENPSLVLENWLENEIKGPFNIDLFSEPFGEKGYKIFNTKKASLLLLKMEMMNSSFEDAIKDFFNTDYKYHLIIKNIGKEKEYKESYTLIKNNLKLDKSTIDRVIETKYFKHFYNDQKQEVYQKWSK